MNSSGLLAEYDRSYSTYAGFERYISSLLPVLLDAAHIRTHKIESRLKSRASLKEKLQRPGKNYTILSDVTDLCGARVITYFAADVDAVATIIEREFEIDRASSIDKRLYADPDRFGYASLHYVFSLGDSRLALTECAGWKGLKAEIQVRTIIQHAWAEIEHDLGFKSPVSIPSSIRRRFSRLAALLETADGEFAGIKNDLVQYSTEVSLELDKPRPNVEINGPSICQLVRSDPIISETDRRISDGAQIPLRPIDDALAASLAAELNFVGISDLTKLHGQIRVHQDKIVEVAVNRLFKGPHSEIATGITLLYTCYAVLAQSRDLTRFVEFFTVHHFGGTDLQETAQHLIDAFNG